jgi:hypothetical protein
MTISSTTIHAPRSISRSANPRSHYGGLGNVEGKHPFPMTLGERLRGLPARRALTRRTLAIAACVSELHLDNPEYHDRA